MPPASLPYCSMIQIQPCSPTHSCNTAACYPANARCPSRALTFPVVIYMPSGHCTPPQLLGACLTLIVLSCLPCQPPAPEPVHSILGFLPGCEGHVGHLVNKCLDDLGVTVALVHSGVRAEEVKVLPFVHIPHKNAFGAGNDNCGWRWKHGRSKERKERKRNRRGRAFMADSLGSGW